MAGTQPAQDSMTVVAMISGSAASMASGAGGLVRPPAQVLSDLLDALTMLLMAEVNPMNQAQHNMEVTKLCDDIAQAKEELNAENTRMATERAALQREAQWLQAESFRLSLDMDA